MKVAFGGGKVKSFCKIKRETTDQRSIIKKEDNTGSSLVQIEYEEEYENEDIQDQTSHIVIEPYDDDEESDSNQIADETSYTKLIKPPSISSSTPMPQSNSKPSPPSLLSSNELFLQSLRSSLDQLSDEKNMRARIKIQEILYQILYETP
jgi:hypothetical protein